MGIFQLKGEKRRRGRDRQRRGREKVPEGKGSENSDSSLMWRSKWKSAAVGRPMPFSLIPPAALVFPHRCFPKFRPYTRLITHRGSPPVSLAFSPAFFSPLTSHSIKRPPSRYGVYECSSNRAALFIPCVLFGFAGPISLVGLAFFCTIWDLSGSCK